MEETKEKREIENEEMEEPQDEAERLGRTQPWTRQITVRGVLVSVVIGATYSVIAMKLNLTNGLVPNLNVSVAVLAFVLIRSWTKMLHKTGFVVKPFTCQENTMIQTCAVACYSIAVGGGFASYLLGLNRKTYELSGEHIEGNSPRAIKEPGFGWMTGFLFLVWFVGLFVLIPFIKMMIADLNLPYPSGLATAVLINGFHAQGGKRDVGSHSSQLLDCKLESKRFLSVALILGDGLYNFVKIVIFTIINIHGRLKRNSNLDTEALDDQQKSTDDLKQNELFLREKISMWMAVAGYVFFSILSIIWVPIIFSQLKWYYVAVVYLLAPSLAFCNAYGAGLTDINMANNYGIVTLFVLAALSVAVNLARDLSPRKLGPWMPLPMVMAVPFLVGAYFAIDMCAGSLIVLAWHKLNSKKAELMIPAVASGLICGEGLWALPAAILALAKINRPICMKFRPS
ncbi:hypothetical protein GH714_022588 [Hevea brasiliensis]|uniref:Uncharacterized protein n=1 Tax=Hevea brasiliensis TaxID=3981 RepID=A0A6A6M9H1_HEVBR|nr:hypothetical protein GH714_022588 [Hevea brasiliensis]